MLLSLQKGWHAIYTITQVILKDILSKASQTQDVYWISLLIGSTQYRLRDGAEQRLPGAECWEEGGVGGGGEWMILVEMMGKF